MLDDVEDPDDANEPGHEECPIRSRDGQHHLLFIEVPEAKRVENRVHLDLRPRVGRATRSSPACSGSAPALDDRRTPDGTGWVVLADPEGNEFCIPRSDAEVAATR